MSHKWIAYIILHMNYKNKRTEEQKCISVKGNIVTTPLYIYFSVALCLTCLIGCGQQQKATGNAISTEPNEVSRTMQVAEDVLIKMHFDIAKADYGRGYIRTRPLAGAQFFEFWRSDNVGLDNQLLSNMHSIRRIVELNITNSDGNPDIDCKVYVQRLSIPQREIWSNSQAYQAFTRSSLEFQRLELNPEQEKDMAWLDLDRDTKLEKEILKRISSTTAKKDKVAKGKTDTAGDNL